MTDVVYDTDNMNNPVLGTVLSLSVVSVSSSDVLLVHTLFWYLFTYMLQQKNLCTSVV